MNSSKATRGLTSISGIEVGHFTLPQRPTGCTVILARSGVTAGVDVRGGAPGTREIILLDPVHTVQKVHAVVLSGGSAFGLASACGVATFLEQQGVGFETEFARVPIVPAAILFDLGVGDASIRPGAEDGFAAASAASDGPVPEGNVGAGAGATVGKLAGMERAMKGGVGSAAVQLNDGLTASGGLTVAALMVVNAVGDVVNPKSGETLAGVRGPAGEVLGDTRKLIRQGVGFTPRPGENTTLGVIATNANLTQAQATKVARMAQDGLARAIYPAHTPWDGDTIFALATGDLEGEADVLTVGALAADMVAEAVMRAVLTAVSLPGLPSARDLAESAARS